MVTTKLSFEDTLPLTCTRAGTCCHGNVVMLNPWELFCLAREKKMGIKDFRNLYTEFGGVRLLFNGKGDWKEKPACSQYIPGFGCSVHLGRPLACRLFPLGRQIQSNETHYMHQGTTFPCLTDCPNVLELPQLSVGEYLKGQQTEQFEKGQDEYLELMQNLADIAFEFLLDTGLAQSLGAETIALWREMGNEAPEMLAMRIGQEWIDRLMIPEISVDEVDANSFVQRHSELLQIRIQEVFGKAATNQELQDASIILMGIALHLARGLGANIDLLSVHWSEEAERVIANEEMNE
jgi:Fe-S-cluster containining protein